MLITQKGLYVMHRNRTTHRTTHTDKTVRRRRWYSRRY